MIKYESIRRIHIEPSSICNAVCPNCPRNVNGGYTVPGLMESVMTLDNAKSFLSESDLKQLTHIRFCGNYGDPAACKDLPRIIEWIMNINPSIQIEINTNGGIRSANWWARLANIIKENANSFVIFSIDGLEDTNSLYRQKVNWNRLQENYKAYINSGGKAVWEMLVFDHNKHQIDQARTLSKKDGFFEFRTKRPFGFDNTYNSDGVMIVRDLDGKYSHSLFPRNRNKVHDTVKHVPALSKDTYNQFKKSSITHDIDNYYQYMNSRPQGIDCMTARDKEIYISVDGFIFPCCFLGHASQASNIGKETALFREWLKTTIGMDKISLHHNSLEMIINSDYFRYIQSSWNKTHQDGKVAMCTLMCSSDCNLNTMKKLYD